MSITGNSSSRSCSKRKAQKHGIKLIFGRPYHPRGRGKIERYHKTFYRELIVLKEFRSLSHFRKELWNFDTLYNNWRNQDVLTWMTPASVYNNKINFNKNRKCLQSGHKLCQKKRTLIVALYTYDSVSNRGEWMREKWRIHRGWIKVRVVVGRNTRNILSMEVTEETVQDESCCIPLIDSAQDSLQPGIIREIRGDGAYDHLTIFNDLEDRNISSSRKIQSNASRQSHGSPYRAECAREFLDAGYPEWAKSHGYGALWTIEGVFSAMKRIYGESVKATSIEGMFHEMRLKFCVDNLLNC